MKSLLTTANKVSLIAIAFATIAASCSSSLSRTEAETIINATYQFPLQRTERFYSGQYAAWQMVSPENVRTDTAFWVDQAIFSWTGERLLIDKGIYVPTITQSYEEAEAYGWGRMKYTKIIELQFAPGKEPPATVGTDTYGTYRDIPVVLFGYGGITTLRKVTDDEYEVELSISAQRIEPYCAAWQRGLMRPNKAPKASEFVQPADMRLTQRIVRLDKGWGIKQDDRDALLRTLGMGL